MARKKISRQLAPLSGQAASENENVASEESQWQNNRNEINGGKNSAKPYLMAKNI
jgi:hypothetical protein